MPELERRDPPDVVRGDEKRFQLLDQFNFHWQDWNYRNIIETVATYSDQQKEYFGTPPKHRGPLIQRIRMEAAVQLTDITQSV